MYHVPFWQYINLTFIQFLWVLSCLASSCLVMWLHSFLCHAHLTILHLCLLSFPAMCYDIPSVVGFCLRFAFCPCLAFHIMSSCASHLHTYSSHASEHFPRCPFRNRHSLMHRRTPLVYFRVRVLNVLGMDRALPSGPGIAPVDQIGRASCRERV